MQPTEIDLRDIIAVLQRQKRLIGLTIALIVGAAFVYLMTATPIYQSSALLQIETRGSNLLDPSSGDGLQSAVVNSKVDSEVEILRSQATALAVIERAALLSDPEFGPSLGLRERIGQAIGIDLSGNRLRRLVGMSPLPEPSGADLVASSITKLQEATDVRRRGLTYLIAVSVSSEDPAKAAELANTTAQVYIERQVGAKTDATLAARDVLRLQLDRARTELAASEDALNGFIETNLARLEAESGNAGVADLRRQLEEAKALQTSGRGRIQSAQTALSRQDWQTVAASLGDAALAELAGQREELQRQLQQSAEGSQESVDLRAALAGIDGDLTSRSDAALGVLRGEINAQGQQEAQARDSLRDALLQADLPSDTLADLYNLQQSATVARNQYQLLLSREQDFGALANLQIADARVVSEALAPTSASFPNKKLILALAVVAALGIGVGLAFLNEYYIGGITSASQLQNVLQTRVAVSVPSMPRSDDNIVLADLVISEPLSPYAETFRKLRAATDLALRDGQLARPPEAAKVAGAGRVILVCSALPGEGKSTAALTLARTYAAAGVDTLLIEADLRKPVLARQLGFEHDSGGLLTLLGTANARKDSAIVTVADPLSSLSILMAGGRSTMPTDQMLGSQSFKTIITAARSSFGAIVIDSPPLLPVADTRYLAQVADVVLQVVRHATTTQGEAREAVHQIKENMRPGVHLLGVLSQVQASRGVGGYNAYRYSGYYGSET
ncbi:MAG: Wzz/FepE/Etk N-terminal domain-containing protein [Pseudomonadota bacterium]